MSGMRRLLAKMPWARSGKRDDTSHLTTGYMPDKFAGLWIWNGRAWHHGPDSPERRSQAIPPQPCTHAYTVLSPYAEDERFCPYCSERIKWPRSGSWIRPGETHLEAMERLVEGEDL